MMAGRSQRPHDNALWSRMDLAIQPGKSLDQIERGHFLDAHTPDSHQSRSSKMHFPPGKSVSQTNYCSRELGSPDRIERSFTTSSTHNPSPDSEYGRSPALTSRASSGVADIVKLRCPPPISRSCAIHVRVYGSPSSCTSRTYTASRPWPCASISSVFPFIRYSGGAFGPSRPPQWWGCGRGFAALHPHPNKLSSRHEPCPQHKHQIPP